MAQVTAALLATILVVLVVAVADAGTLSAAPQLVASAIVGVSWTLLVASRREVDRVRLELRRQSFKAQLSRRGLESRLAEVSRQALHDPLTDLPNRALFADRLDHALARAEREHLPLGLLYIDLDDFKSINDRFGHAAGDEVLLHVARRLSEQLRHGDTAGRLGGDEFVILLEAATETEARQIARRIAEALQAPMRIDGKGHSVSASIGVASASAGASVSGAAALVKRADTAMYAAKRGRTPFSTRSVC